MVFITGCAGFASYILLLEAKRNEICLFRMRFASGIEKVRIFFSSFGFKFFTSYKMSKKGHIFCFVLLQSVSFRFIFSRFTSEQKLKKFSLLFPFFSMYSLRIFHVSPRCELREKKLLLLHASEKSFGSVSPRYTSKITCTRTLLLTGHLFSTSKRPESVFVNILRNLGIDS